MAAMPPAVIMVLNFFCKGYLEKLSFRPVERLGVYAYLNLNKNPDFSKQPKVKEVADSSGLIRWWPWGEVFFRIGGFVGV